MLHYNEIMDIYKLNPISAYKNDIWNDDEETDYISECILMTLYAIDEIIRDNSSNYFYYIKGVDSISYVLNEILTGGINEEVYEKSMFRLDFSKLVYKFTCAKKFGIRDESICQLRINSWGREYIKNEELLIKYSDEYRRIKDFFQKYYDEHSDLFKEITDLLLKSIDKENAVKIEKINEQLCVKVLS